LSLHSIEKQGKDPPLLRVTAQAQACDGMKAFVLSDCSGLDMVSLILRRRRVVALGLEIALASGKNMPNG
jgi:hypothetical protein